MDNTWFYPAQKKAMDILNKKYDSKSCQSQTITKDRVIEKYICFTSLHNGELITVEYINCVGIVSVLIAKVEYTEDFYL